MRRVTKVFKTLASAVMVSGAALALVLPSAAALPPGGADDSTEGTSSTVTGSVEAGGTLSFSLSGFPAGETVSIKIDDGALDGSDNSVSGTGVVHQQKIGANGSVSGSFVLPSYVKPGTHWLRFLASQEIPESQGGGTKGFSNRSPQFTVTGSASDSGDQGGAGGVAAGSGSGASGAGGSSNAGGSAGAAGSDSGAGATGANSGAGAGGVAGSQATASAGASAKPTSGTLKVTASPSAKKKAQPAATTVTTIVAMEQSPKSAFPVLGVSVFSAALLIGAVAIGAVLLRNRRRAGAAGAGLAGAAAAGAGAAVAGGANSVGAGAGAGKSAGAGGVGNSPGPAA